MVNTATYPVTPVLTLDVERRVAGVAVTLLVHLALILAWHLARTLPPVQPDGPATLLQWIDLPQPAPRVEPAPATAPRVADAPGTGGKKRPRPALVPPAQPAGEALASPAIAAPAASAEPAVDASTTPSAASMLENARRSAGAIDRALRKEAKPTIVLPPDSPQIRLREGMEHARAMAPPRLWEAPKVEELVNNTGDGARRTRVINGNRTYCITERSPTASIDMIEKHGKQTFTNCPSHEEPAKRQVWRTARD